MLGVKPPRRRPLSQFDSGPFDEMDEEQDGSPANSSGAQGISAEPAPQLLQPAVSARFTRGEDDGGVEANAAAGRQRLAQALMEKTAQSGNDVGSPWETLGHLAETLSDAVRRRKEEEAALSRNGF